MNQSKIRQLARKDLEDENFDVTEAGIYFPKHGFLAKGEYFDRINGGELEHSLNLITKEGRIAALNTFLGSKAKPAGLYIALYNGSATPSANWTGANFATTAGEITSQTEGYAGATRPAFVPLDATDQEYIDNAGSTARVTFTTSSAINVTGAALLTTSARGGTTGVLISAVKYPAVRTFQNGDQYDIGYRLSFLA